jgi:rRNA maturation endonuclease Nob1
MSDNNQHLPRSPDPFVTGRWSREVREEVDYYGLCTACKNFTVFHMEYKADRECHFCDVGTEKQKKDFLWYADNNRRGLIERRERNQSIKGEHEKKTLIEEHKMCEYCYHKVSPTARTCPSCGHDLIMQRKKYNSFWYALFGTFFD